MIGIDTLTAVGGFWDYNFIGESGNEVWRILLYGVIVVLTVMLSKSVSYFVQNVVKRFTKETRFKLDDLILGAIERPISLIVLFCGVYFGLYLIRVNGVYLATILQGVFLVATTVVVTYVIARLYGDILGYILRRLVEDTETRLDDQLLPLAVKGGRFVIWALGLMIAFSYAGVDVTSLIAGLGIGGLALAMAAKDTVANVFGGVSIFADRPFEIGDIVKIKGELGKVEEIGVRTTRIRTFDDTVFILPNSSVADSPVENQSKRRRRKQVMTLGLTYDTTYEQMVQARELLETILKDFEGIDDDYVIRFDEFGESALNILVVYWAKNPDDFFTILDEVNMRVLKELNAAGLELAFPTRTVYVKK